MQQIEENLFTIKIFYQLKNEPVNQGSEPVKQDFQIKIKDKMEIQEQILILIQQDKDISYNEMAKRLNKSRTTVMRNIKKLKELNNTLELVQINQDIGK